VLKLVVIVLSVCYPFMVYWGLNHYDVKWLLLILLVLLAMRWLVIDAQGERYVVAATIVCVSAIVFLWGEKVGLKFYPVMVSTGFFVLFASSLFTSMSFVERLARLRESTVSEKAKAYMRQVTIAWCVFFVLNGTVAAYTALWGSEELWVLYNGLISYLLMGVLAGGEWLVRQRVKNG